MANKNINKNLDSVKCHWNTLLNSKNDNNVNLVNRICSEKYKHRLDKIFDTNELYFDSAYIPFDYSLLLNLFNREASWIEHYKKKGIKISSKVRNYLNYHDEQNVNNNSVMLYTASETLKGFVILACLERFNSPSLPKKETLLEGIMPFIKRLKNSKSKIPFEEKEKCILASVMALLSDEIELSSQFLSYCKSFKEVKYHFLILNQITEVLLSHNNLSENPKVEANFFDIFNAYRLPSVRQKRLALGEYAIMDNLVSNYLFAWLYLKLFEGKSETTWEEMRLIMMA